MKKARPISVAASHRFEIRIAVLGYVSAGKTTVINALLRDTYGQVGMRRTTAAVNCFRLHQRHHRTTTQSRKKAKKSVDAADEPVSSKVNVGGDVAAGDDSRQRDSRQRAPNDNDSEEEDELTCVPATEALREISADNLTLREGTAVSVKWFDVYTGRHVLCEVRPDTRLVLVDIPGINEAGAAGKYREYVREHWDTFDCVLVVMDGRLGANTEEQVKLLKFVRDNNRDKKDVATIILCNKVDDPDDLEQAELVKEAKEEVDRIFNEGEKCEGVGSFHDRPPIFVPMSAEFAYIFRTAALMKLEQFRRFDKDLIDRLGRKEIGRRFNKLSVDEKFRLVFDALGDKELLPDRIQDTNFNSVLSAIAASVGGSDVQLDLIQRQIDVSLRGISHKKPGISETIRSVFDKRRALDQPTDDLPKYFWAAFDKCVEAAFQSFAESPGRVNAVSVPLKDLIAYCTFAKAEGLDNERRMCVTRFKALVSRQIGLILGKDAIALAVWTIREPDEVVRWGMIHHIDWFNLLQSILLLLHNKIFCEAFGNEIMLLEAAKQKWVATLNAEPSFGVCPKCSENPFDFNNFCSRCALFVSPTHSAGLAGLKRTTYGVRGSGSGSTRQGVFEVVPGAKKIGPALFCDEPCAKPLNSNRFCDECRSIYCLQGNNRSIRCFMCSSKVEEGRCMGTCGAQTLTWKELPFASLMDVIRREYDATDGTFQPKYPESYRSVVRLAVPDHLSDPLHFGHVAWQYCQFVESNDDSAKDFGGG